MASAFEVRLNLSYMGCFADEEDRKRLCYDLSEKVFDLLIKTDQNHIATFMTSLPLPSLNTSITSKLSKIPEDAVVYVERVVDHIRYTACLETEKSGLVLDAWDDKRLPSQGTFN